MKETGKREAWRKLYNGELYNV